MSAQCNKCGGDIAHDEGGWPVCPSCQHNEDLKLASRQLACVVRLALGAGVTAEEVDDALAKLTTDCRDGAEGNLL